MEMQRNKHVRWKHKLQWHLSHQHNYMTMTINKNKQIKTIQNIGAKGHTKLI